MKKTYKIKSNISTDREYFVEADETQSFDIVWASQKYWFMQGSKVTITDDKGNSQTYVK